VLPGPPGRQKAAFAHGRATFAPVGAGLGATPPVPAFARSLAGKARNMGIDTELSLEARARRHPGRASASASA
jgi:hypothetical protein